MKKFLLAGILAVPFAAFAGTASDSFTVTASVPAYCEITTGANGVSVDYNPLSSNAVTASVSTKFNCVKGTQYSISVSTSSELVKEDNSGETLQFTATVSSNGGTDTDGSTSAEKVDVAIVIPENQNVSVGNYTGNVTVKIQY